MDAESDPMKTVELALGKTLSLGTDTSEANKQNRTISLGRGKKPPGKAPDKRKGNMYQEWG
jgi:hypothetical protein